MISEKETQNNIHKEELSIISVDFEKDGEIPQRFNSENENMIPTFKISNIPENTKSLAIVMEDTDTSGPNHYHWIVYNIDPKLTEFGGQIPFGKTGKNSRTLKNYEGVNPISGRHRYRFTIYTLEHELELKEGYSSEELRDLINKTAFNKAHVEAYSEKIGDFSHS